MTSVSTFLAAVPAVVLYFVAAAAVFGESAALIGVVVPGELILLAGGALTRLGHGSLLVLIVVATAGAVAGNATGYWVGQRFGPAVRAGRIARRIGTERWTRAEGLLARRGSAVVLAARWVGGLRSLVPAAAGMTRMPFRRYMIANVCGAAVWVSCICTLGYFTGNALNSSVLGDAPAGRSTNRATWRATGC